MAEAERVNKTLFFTSLSLSLSRPPPSCSTPTFGLTRKEKTRKGIKHLSFFDRRKREKEGEKRDNFSADRNNSSYVDKRREKRGRNELLSSLGKRTRVCPTRVLKSRIVCTRREIIRANIVKISGGTRNKHGEREGGRTGGQEDNRSNKEKVSFLF